MKPTDVSAMAFFNGARKYHQAANQLFDLQAPSDPTNFLYFHTVELALKAFSRSHGLPILNETKRKNHKLTELYEECRGLGLKIGPDDRTGLGNIMALLEKGNQYQGFRYYNLISTATADLRWTHEVVEQLMQVLGPELEARRKQDTIPSRPGKGVVVFGKPLPQ